MRVPWLRVGWITGVIVLIGLTLTMPYYASGCAPCDESDFSSDSLFGLIHRQGDPENLSNQYELGLAVVLFATVALVALDLHNVRERASRRAKPASPNDQ